MTPSTSPDPDTDGRGRGLAVRDLSSVFGTSAAASLHGRRPGRGRTGRGGAGPGADGDARLPARGRPGTETEEGDDVQDSTNRRTRSRRRSAAPSARDPGGGQPRPRLRVVRVRDRDQVTALLLAVAGTGPASGREFVDLVRERSDGVFALSEATVYREVQRLVNDRLIRVTRRGGARRYLLTALGERILGSRRRDWAAFSHGFDNVLAAADAER